ITADAATRPGGVELPGSPQVGGPIGPEGISGRGVDAVLGIGVGETIDAANEGRIAAQGGDRETGLGESFESRGGAGSTADPNTSTQVTEIDHHRRPFAGRAGVRPSGPARCDE